MSEETRSPETGEERPDERIGELLQRHRSLYHEPPATPRDEMWARIEAARGGANEGRGRVISLAPRRWWLGTLAVAAVLALGIALGRISMRDEAERKGQAGPPVAESPAPREPETGTARPIAEPGVETAAPSELAVAPAETEVAPRETPARAVARPDAGRRAPAREAPAPGPSTASDLYRLASQQMLGQAEALLVQYRSDRAADRMDPAVGRWARDVLSSTRLLLDSPAADDPGMRDLLRDLELVLAQIVQRTGEPDPLDEEMIDRTIEDRDLMPRIRGAIPTGVGAI